MATPTFSVANLELRARQRADMENSTFIGSAELTALVDRSFQELYLKVAAEFDDLVVSPGPFPRTLTAGSYTYELPFDFLKLKGIMLEQNGYSHYFLSPITNLLEMEPYMRGNFPRGRPTHYWLHGITTAISSPAQLTIFPIPDAEYTAQIYYVPNIGLGEVDTTYGLAFLAGWDEYVVITAAMKMRDKEEGDCTLLMAERNQLWESMKRALTPLDESSPKHVVSLTGLRNRRLDFNADPFDAEVF